MVHLVKYLVHSNVKDHDVHNLKSMNTHLPPEYILTCFLHVHLLNFAWLRILIKFVFISIPQLITRKARLAMERNTF